MMRKPGDENNKNDQLGGYCVGVLPNSSHRHLISPYNINTLSSSQVMRITKMINQGILP